MSVGIEDYDIFKVKGGSFYTFWKQVFYLIIKQPIGSQRPAHESDVKITCHYLRTRVFHGEDPIQWNCKEYNHMPFQGSHALVWVLKECRWALWHHSWVTWQAQVSQLPWFSQTPLSIYPLSWVIMALHSLGCPCTGLCCQGNLADQCLCWSNQWVRQYTLFWLHFCWSTTRSQQFGGASSSTLEEIRGIST